MRSGEPFIGIRLRGGRYDEPGFPVETVEELARYERMIVEIASALWRSEHPGRQRLPRGFRNQFRLRLTRVETGSVIPVLERALPLNALFHEDSALYESSRDSLHAFLLAIEAGGPLPNEFPREALRGFQTFGSSLGESERIEFTVHGLPTARLDRSARASILERSDLESLILQDTLSGRVTALDTEKQTFTLIGRDDKHIGGRFSDPELTDDFVEAIDQKQAAMLMRLTCDVAVGRDGAQLGVTDVSAIEAFLADGHPLRQRLLLLAGLKAGWLDGGGEVVDMTALEMVRDFSQALIDAQEPSRMVAFPMPDGGVELEWRQGTRDCSLEVHSDLSIQSHELDSATGDDRLDRFEHLRDAIGRFCG